LQIPEIDAWQLMIVYLPCCLCHFELWGWPTCNYVISTYWNGSSSMPRKI